MIKTQCIFSIIVITASVSTSFGYDWSTNPGDGSRDNPFQISEPDQLIAISSNADLLNKHYVLINDIVFDPTNNPQHIFDKAVIAPKMTSANDSYGVYFSGVFDGSGFVIYDLTIDTNGTSNDFLGLFGYIKNGIVKNLGIEQIHITGSQSNWLGGLCGWVVESSIVNCYTTGAITGSNPVGGLCSRNDGIISNCYSSVDVDGGTGDQGGLCGHNYGVINNCYSSGSVNESSYSGGLCAYNYSNVRINRYGQISNCYFLDTAGPDNGIGTPLTDAQMKQQSSFAGWDFSNEKSDGTAEIWMFSDGGYPAITLFDENFIGYAFDGQGTSEKPYLIYDANDLGAIWQQFGKYYKLANDIDLAGITYSMAVHEVFDGSIDGDGHAIKNLSINGGDYLGLFGRLTGQVSNLGIEDVIIEGGEFSQYIGGLCGRNHGGSIRNCYAAGSVSGYRSVGGLVGINFIGSILNSYATVLVDGQVEIGGLLGANYGIVSNCNSTGSATGDYATGGLVGDNFDVIMNSFSVSEVFGNNKAGGLVGNNQYGYLSSCFSKGSVSGYEHVGGLVGTELGTTTNCYATGSVSGYRYVGGFAGGSGGGGISTNCYSTGLVDGDLSTGGFSGGAGSIREFNCFWDMDTSGMIDGSRGTGLTTAQMQMLSNFIDGGWDFVDESPNGTGEVWHMPTGGGYPELSFYDMSRPILLEGAGSQSDPYLIGTPEQLGMISWYPSDACFELINDVNLVEINSSEAIAPVFNGNFNGNGHSVSNMNISGGGYLGFFGYLGVNSNVRNLNLEDIVIDSPGNVVGGLVGFSKATLNNCSVTGNITGGYYADFYGGLVGYNDEGGKVSNCYAVSNVLCGNGAYNTGGLLGRNQYAEVLNCYAMGSVTGNKGAGGFVGENRGGNISRCYSTCTVASTSTQYKGGFIGDRDSVYKCFWDVEASGFGSIGSSNKGAYGKTTIEMCEPNTFVSAGWDFVNETSNGTDDIWFIKTPGETYPKFYWENALPTADAGEDQVALTQSGGNTMVHLDGTGSYDPDGDGLEYSWFHDSNEIATGAEPNILLPAGEHVIELIVYDGVHYSLPDSCVITVLPATETQIRTRPKVSSINKLPLTMLVKMKLPSGTETFDFETPMILGPWGIDSYDQHPVTHGKNNFVFSYFTLDSSLEFQIGSINIMAIGKLQSGEYIYGSGTIRLH